MPGSGTEFHPPSLGDFAIDSATLEVRYKQALLLWDSAGVLWSTLRGGFSNLDLEQVQPIAVTALANQRFALAVELERASITDLTPARSLDDVGGVATRFVDTVVECLALSEFVRVGCRLMFVKEVDEKSEAAAILLSGGLMRSPEDGRFGVKEAVPVGAEYQVRFEGAATGALLRIRTEEKKAEIKGHPSVPEVKPFKRVATRVVLDLDYYSTVPVKRGQLDPRRWVDETLHVARRDLPRYLAGEK